MCMKAMIIVGPPQAIPRISIPLAMMLRNASKLAKLLNRVLYLLCSAGNVGGISGPGDRLVPLVAP